MARKFEYMSGKYAWNLEKCEEEILIAAYDEIYQFIPPDQKWAPDKMFKASPESEWRNYIGTTADELTMTPN